MIKHWRRYVLTALLSFVGVSQAQVDKVVDLPIDSLKAVESNGQILFMSGNGRFVIQGQMTDIWSKKTVDTIRELEDIAAKIHLRDYGLDVDNLNTLPMGSGEHEVIVFTDPRCGTCHQLFELIPDLLEQYTFKFIVVPALGKESHLQARKLFCTADKQKALNALINHTIDQLPDAENCDIAMYDQTLLLAQLLNIKAVPMLIAPNGLWMQGRPPKLGPWLEANL